MRLLFGIIFLINPVIFCYGTSDIYTNDVEYLSLNVKKEHSAWLAQVYDMPSFMEVNPETFFKNFNVFHYHYVSKKRETNGSAQMRKVSLYKCQSSLCFESTEDTLSCTGDNYKVFLDKHSQEFIIKSDMCYIRGLLNKPLRKIGRMIIIQKRSGRIVQTGTLSEIK